MKRERHHSIGVVLCPILSVLTVVIGKTVRWRATWNSSDLWERVFATLDETFPGMNWQKLAGYMISRVVEHESDGRVMRGT